MPRFYFHVRSPDDFTRDEDGIELADAGRAMREAELGARDILAEALKRGHVIDGQVFEVEDERGVLVFRYPLKDAMRLA